MAGRRSRLSPIKAMHGNAKRLHGTCTYPFAIAIGEPLTGIWEDLIDGRTPRIVHAAGHLGRADHPACDGGGARPRPSDLHFDPHQSTARSVSGPRSQGRP